MTSTLTAARVYEIFLDCLFKEDEDPSQAVIAEGVQLKAGFHPDRLTKHKEDIMELLVQLPEQFLYSGGGGWSFLQACMTEKGVQWGEHANIDQLLVLGLASDQVEFSLPPEVWAALPGGVPYFAVKDTTLKERFI